MVLIVCAIAIAFANKVMKQDYGCSLGKELIRVISPAFGWMLYKIIYAVLWCIGWVIIWYAMLFNEKDYLTEDDYYE